MLQRKNKQIFHNKQYNDRNRGFEKQEELLKTVTEVIHHGFTKANQIEIFDEFSKFIKGVSTSQIRIVYGELTRLKMKFDQHAFLMIKPKIAYASGRNKSPNYKALKDMVAHGVDTVSEQQDSQQGFRNFTSIFEAILAYHKAHGGQ